MLRTLTATVVLTLALATPAVSHPTDPARHHRPGCHSARCDRAADAAYRRHLLREHPRATLWDLCIANKETGEPGSLERRFIRTTEREGIYSGPFQEEQSKWEAGGGLTYAPEPWEAKWWQQLRVFHRHGRQGEWTYGNWPTIAGCEQYRPG